MGKKFSASNVKLRAFFFTKSTFKYVLLATVRKFNVRTQSGMKTLDLGKNFEISNQMTFWPKVRFGLAFLIRALTMRVESRVVKLKTPKDF